MKRSTVAFFEHIACDVLKASAKKLYTWELFGLHLRRAGACSRRFPSMLTTRAACMAPHHFGGLGWWEFRWYGNKRYRTYQLPSHPLRGSSPRGRASVSKSRPPGEVAHQWCDGEGLHRRERRPLSVYHIFTDTQKACRYFGKLFLLCLHISDTGHSPHFGDLAVHISLPNITSL